MLTTVLLSDTQMGGKNSVILFLDYILGTDLLERLIGKQATTVP